MLRHAGLGCEDFFDVETETQAVFVAARKFGNHTNHLDIAPLPFIREAHRKTLFGLPCSVIETESAGEGGEEQGVYKAGKPVASAKARKNKGEGKAEQQPRPDEFRQGGLLLQQPHADGEADCEKNHARRLTQTASKAMSKSFMDDSGGSYRMKLCANYSANSCHRTKR